MSSGRQESKPRNLHVITGGVPKGPKWDPDALASLVEGTVARQERTHTILEEMRDKLDNFIEVQMAHNAWVMSGMKQMMRKLDVKEPPPPSSSGEKKPASRRKR